MHNATSEHRQGHWRATISVGAMLVVAAVAVSACGKSHPAIGAGGNGGDGLGDTCTDVGATRPCHILVSQGSGFSNCMAGTQTCNGTVWGGCAAGGTMGTAYGVALTSTIPKGVGGKPRNYTAPSSNIHVLDDPTPPSAAASLCAADPCDPYCFGWDDVGTPELQPSPPYGSIALLPPVAQVNAVSCKDDKNKGYEPQCQYDTCCGQDNSSCKPGISTTTGRCKPSGDSWGNVGQTGGGNCQAGIDYTAQVACDDVALDTHVSICNRGGVDDTTNTLYVGFVAGATPNTYPIVAPNGCTINFALLPGGLGKGGCVDYDVTAGTVDGVAAPVTCVAALATPALRTAALVPNTAIFLNGNTAYGATSKTDVRVTECDSANNWSYSAHLPCIIPPPPVGGAFFAPIATLSPNKNTNPCNPAGATAATAKECQYDTCCAPIINTCVDWNSAVGGTCDPATAPAMAAIGGNSIGSCATNPDYTISVGCNVNGQGSDTDRHFQICNRGGVAAPVVAGTTLWIGFGDDGQNWGYNFNADAYCTLRLDLIGGLPPNTCGDLNAVGTNAGAEFNGSTTGVDCSSLGVNGKNRSKFFDGTDRFVRVNTTGPNGDSTGDGNDALPECNGANNWSYRQQSLDCATAVPPPPPAPTVYTYTGVCQPGYHARWKWLSWTLSAGAGSVSFDATTRLKDPFTGVLGAASPSVNLANPPIAPTYTKCDYTNNNPPCPINLGDPNIMPQKFTTLEAIGDVMTLTTTPTGGVYPVTFGVAYDCIPYE